MGDCRNITAVLGQRRKGTLDVNLDTVYNHKNGINKIKVELSLRKPQETLQISSILNQIKIY